MDTVLIEQHAEFPREPQSQDGDDRDDRQPRQVGEEERDDADGRRGLADLDHREVDHAPPDRVIAEADDQRKHHRQGDDQGRNGLETAARDDVHHHLYGCPVSVSLTLRWSNDKGT